MKILITESQLHTIKEMSMSTYHGTPHDFDKFNIEKVGSGESTQWFGWGLYFTDDESISDWYASSVAKSKNEDHIDKKCQFYFKDNLIYDGEPRYIARGSFWPFVRLFTETIGIPSTIVVSISKSFERFIEYKKNEIKGTPQTFPFFDRDKFINDFNEKIEYAKRQYDWSPRMYKDEETNKWISTNYDTNDPYILKSVKSLNKKYPSNNLTPEQYIKKFETKIIYQQLWDIVGQGNKPVDFNLFSDEKLTEYRDLLLRLLESIQPEDFKLKMNDPLFTKTIKYHVTLHKGKTPNEYDYLNWYNEMTPEQKQKILNKLKEKGYKSKKFFMVVPQDDDNLEGIKPRFFNHLDNAKSYIERNYMKVRISGEGYIGSLKIVKTGLSIKNDINDTVQSFYTKLCGLIGSDKLASMFLLSAGIDGIKYPNNSVSGGKTTGYNYVVFDEKSVHIDKKEDRDL